MSHLVFLPDPDRPRFFLWGASSEPSVAGRLDAGQGERARVVDESLVPGDVEGTSFPLLHALPGLAALTTAEIARAPSSVGAWSLGAKLALDLVSREKVVPRVVVTNGKSEARCGVALGLLEDAERVRLLAKAFPAAAHWIPAGPAKPTNKDRQSRRRREPRVGDRARRHSVFRP